VVSAWQGWLGDQGLLDIGVRRVLALRAQRREWEERPPETPVIAAGIGLGGTVPAAADLLATIGTRLPCGFVVIPGEDEASARLDGELLTECCTHPYAGQRRMLARMGATMAEARPWTDDEPPAGDRAALLGTAMLPSGGLRAWQKRDPARWSTAMGGLHRIEAADSQGEAAAIALTLRGALERPGARAALVTPDRDLACRVAGELPRHGILAEDSAGQKLSATPNGVLSAPRRPPRRRGMRAGAAAGRHEAPALRRRLGSATTGSPRCACWSCGAARPLAGAGLRRAARGARRHPPGRDARAAGRAARRAGGRARQFRLVAAPRRAAPGG
jgi:ATP-dependent helicase/nuclease subunit B